MNNQVGVTIPLLQQYMHVLGVTKHQKNYFQLIYFLVFSSAKKECVTSQHCLFWFDHQSLTLVSFENFVVWKNLSLLLLLVLFYWICWRSSLTCKKWMKIYFNKINLHTLTALIYLHEFVTVFLHASLCANSSK